MIGPGHAGDVDHLEILDVDARLREEYRAYRRRQARKLLGILPREAIRPLLREALRGDAPRAREGGLEALVHYCESLLPLPPIDVWAEDATLHPEAHLADLDESADVPSSEVPATIAARAFEFERESWTAHLRGYRDGSAWRGYIVFEHRSSRRAHRTSPIFRESDPGEVCARFADFENDTLEAFLRSSLP